ncbi:MAG: HAMP domain-containing sensor histidine kinase [Sedimentisphaerales bacterium]
MKVGLRQVQSNRGGFIAGRNQLQWVVLLLAAAVVLPTVSLLWFMSRVVANERLVVKEKLAALYQDKLADAAKKTEVLYAAMLKALDKAEPTGNPYSFFTKIVLENGFQGVVIVDASGAVVYPVSADVVGDDIVQGNPLAGAWQLEFTARQYSEAAQFYDRFLADNDPHVAIAAIMGKSRCLSRLGRLDEAIECCRKAAAFAAPAKGADPALRLAVENARLSLLTLLKQSAEQSAPSALSSQGRSELFRRTAGELIADLYNTSGDRALLPANQNLFIAKRLLQILASTSLFEGPATAEKDRIEKLVAAEELSISVAENQRLFTGRLDGCFRIDLGQRPVYGLRHKTRSVTLLCLLEDKGIESVLAGYRDAFTGSETSYRIVDVSGAYMAGEPQPQGEPFATATLPACLPGWKVELYFKGGEVFEKAAKRQIAVYIWTGVLVILLILAAGGFATRAVGRQIRLNKMKNDFIATVSHELKTPLASMRVLVDTLLEGNVKDEAQTEEYLRMTSKENERLSRMIDNFLTFSRMERNKKAFTISDVKPAAIANDAAEAVRAKFAANNCQFAVDIADNLPDIQADHDAMVTVLVNLLDNACKYTGDQKQITLKVFAEKDNVCFAVSDNGIGLAQRHIRKIFDSFYQVDNSLARKAEGCGLGLSIVKFIVDAHKGAISVDSKPGKGSAFTVKIPLSAKVTN